MINYKMSLMITIVILLFLQTAQRLSEHFFGNEAVLNVTLAALSKLLQHDHDESATEPATVL